ncbi:MAG: hypothetical protein LBC19_05005, partial [Tannerella sp.]|nr:hypothetical protein [Tannerella sp.]
MSSFLFKYVIICGMFVGMLTACQKQTSPDILSEQTFEDMISKAGKEQKYLCIILVDSGQHNTMDLLKNQ